MAALHFTETLSIYNDVLRRLLDHNFLKDFTEAKLISEDSEYTLEKYFVSIIC